jgi:hypothetical protein
MGKMLTKPAVRKNLSGIISPKLTEESRLKFCIRPTRSEVRPIVSATNSKRRAASGVAIDEVEAKFARSSARSTRNADLVPNSRLNRRETERHQNVK